MTKKVRIENADTNSSVEVVIEAFEGDRLLSTTVLSHPTFQHEDYIWDGKRLVITERKKNES